ncbi:putative iron reductase domain protein [Durotheca rogersii]|uniref:putative iron reductase domain protein n=1 Tax=Durotheca rogersii TaxID=419775 RepID=UPI00221F9979|nr:putative iron reductase domain protein [Durotheca rogersii]KAI5860899.1 putative iron reductase domain protein [Durotheca rogersii]
MKWSVIAAGIAGLASPVLAQLDSTPFVDADTGITFQSYTSAEGITYRLALPENATDEAGYDVILQVVAPVELGWAGWAWGGAMVYNPLTIVWHDGNTVHHSPRQATGYYVPAVYPDSQYTVLDGTGVNETHFKFTALCAGCASWADFEGNPFILNGAGDTNFAYAYSMSPVEEPTNPETGFSIHDHVGRWIHDLAGARSDKFAEWIATNTPE